MGISSFQAAKTMCHISGWTISNLKLQKLLYLGHTLSLGRTNEPLVSEEFSAWMFGPVLSSVYERVKAFGNDPIRDVFFIIDVLPNADDNYSLLEKVYKAFGSKKAWELVRLTHWPKGAWAKNYEPCYKRTIPNKDIIDEYKAKVSRH